MTKAIQPYAVPLLAGDLRRAELIKQFADTFEYLDLVSQDMFNRIAIRLNVYRAQLNKFDERIQHATAHIERIKGSKRAIQVHSSARYPVEQTRSTYTSIFECDSEKDEHKPPMLHFNTFRLNETVDKFIDPNDKESKSNDDTLVVLKQYENNDIQKTKKNVVVGLGKPPAHIKSVVSFLKYNTQENPYTQPTKIDPLNMTGRVRKQVVEPNQSRISETPAPAFYKQMTERTTANGISYNPSMGFVPELTLPDNLPELDNYATFDDNATIEWTKQQMPSIAPSFGISMLPDIDELSSTGNITQTVEPPKPTVPAPPPVNIPAIIPLTSTVTTAPPPAPPSLPPPAPALPSSLPSVLTPPSTTDESQASTDNPPNVVGGGGGNDDDDGGNPLLAEIRNFGKKNKLKTTEKSDPLDATPLPTSQGGESMMDSLKQRLLARRRFIAGDNDAPSSSGAEKSIAAPTPPPMPSTGNTFTDEIAKKAIEIAVEQEQLRNSDSDTDSNNSDWE